MQTEIKAESAKTQIEERLRWVMRRARESMEPGVVARLTDELEGIINQHPPSRLGAIQEFDTSRLADHWKRLAIRMSLLSTARSLADTARQMSDERLMARLARVEECFAQDAQAAEFIRTGEIPWEELRSRTIYSICEDAGLSPIVVSLLPKDRIEECEIALNNSDSHAYTLSVIGSTIFDDWWSRFIDRYLAEPHADEDLGALVVALQKDLIRFVSLLRAYPVAEQRPDRLEPFAALDRNIENLEDPEYVVKPSPDPWILRVRKRASSMETELHSVFDLAGYKPFICTTLL